MVCFIISHQLFTATWINPPTSQENCCLLVFITFPTIVPMTTTKGGVYHTRGITTDRPMWRRLTIRRPFRDVHRFEPLSSQSTHQPMPVSDEGKSHVTMESATTKLAARLLMPQATEVRNFTFCYAICQLCTFYERIWINLFINTSLIVSFSSNVFKCCYFMPWINLHQYPAQQ